MTVKAETAQSRDACAEKDSWRAAATSAAVGGGASSSQPRRSRSDCASRRSSSQPSSSTSTQPAVRLYALAWCASAKQPTPKINATMTGWVVRRLLPIQGLMPRGRRRRHSDRRRPRTRAIIRCPTARRGARAAGRRPSVCGFAAFAAWTWLGCWSCFTRGGWARVGAETIIDK